MPVKKPHALRKDPAKFRSASLASLGDAVATKTAPTLHLGAAICPKHA